MLDIDAVAEVVAGAVRQATEPLLARIDALEKRELLLPEKGEPGVGIAKAEVRQNILELTLTDGTVLAAGDVGPRHGKNGADGKDGVGLADALIDKDGHLVLTMTDGRTKSLCQVVGNDGKDGEPGKDGADGITPTFLDAEFVGRTLRLSFDGDRVCEFQLATPEYAGVYKDGQTYEPGDMVTWAGSTWHCDKATTAKPGTEDWTLAVKKGRDGKDAK